jgi:hypothetical protein
MPTAGAMANFDVTRLASVRAGNAGSTEIDVDGNSVGTLGAAGEVRIAELGPGGSRFREGGEADDCTKGL